MPRNSTRRPATGQALSRARKATSAAQRKAQTIRKQQARKTAALYKSVLREASKRGLYSPKSQELTKYRRHRAREELAKHGDLLDPKKFFFLPVPKKRRKEVKGKAGYLQLQTSKTGIFYPRQGYKRASLKVSKKTGELYIKRSGKVKKGPNGQSERKGIIPIAGLDELDKEKQRLRELAKKFGPLKNNEAFAFVVHEADYDGFSRRTYTDIDNLLADLDLYKLNTHRVQFYRGIELEVTESNMQWQLEHPPKTWNESRARSRRSAYERATGRA